MIRCGIDKRVPLSLLLHSADMLQCICVGASLGDGCIYLRYKFA